MNELVACCFTDKRKTPGHATKKLLLELPILWLVVGATQDDATLRGACEGIGRARIL
jgi:hypothetical protein